MAVFNNILAGASGATGAAGYEITRSLRFNSADSAHLYRQITTKGNTKTFTFSCWLKKVRTGLIAHNIFSGSTGTDTGAYFCIPDNSANALGTADSLVFKCDPGAGGGSVQTDAIFRDLSAWYHVVLAVDTTQATASDRVKIWVNGVSQTLSQSASPGYPNQNSELSINDVGHAAIAAEANGSSSSVRFLGSFYLADVHFIDGQALAPTDFGEYDDNNVWQPKAYSGTYGTNGFHLDFSDNSSDAALGTDSSGNDNTWTVNNLSVTTPAVTTSSITSATAFNTNYNSYLTSMTLDSDGAAANDRSGTTSDVFDNSVTTGIRGSKNDSGDAEIEFTFPSNLISVTSQVRVRAECSTKGVALIQCTIGGNTTSYTWENINSGENRWYNFSGSGALTKVRVYNNNDGSGLSGPIAIYQIEVDGNVLLNESGTDLEFTNNTNFSSIVVGAQTTNTGSIVSKNGSASPPTIRVSGGTWSTGGTLTQAVIVGDDLKDSPTNSTDSSDNPVGNYATLNPLSGFGTLSNGNLDNTGDTAAWRSRPGTIGMSSGKWYFEWTHGGGTAHIIGIGPSQIAGAGYVGDNAYGYGYYSSNGQKYNSGAGSSYGDTWTTGDVIGVAFDADGGNLYFYKNGTAQNSGTAAFTGLTSGPYFPVISLNGTSNTGSINFGQAPFNFTPPSGYKALCTQNLPDPTIADGSTAMDVITYNGTDTTRTFTGFNFSPDMAWFKSRSTTYDHILFDIVRGTTKRLKPNSTAAEDTNSTGLTAFTSDGFTVGGADSVNGPSYETYVAWAWDGGTSTVSNTDGSITSSVRANASAGFSIVSYTGNGTIGATVGHGLGANVALYFLKNRSNAADWPVLGHALNDAFGGSNKYLLLNSTAAAGNAAQGPGNSSTIELYDDATNNTNGDNYIAYCFAPVEGYSAFGSYTGNGSTDGPFIYTGFRPRWLLVKLSSTAGENWIIKDAARDIDNPAELNLLANSSSQETSVSVRNIDLLSNGFKPRGDDSNINANTYTYVWAAFAEHPLKYARAR